MLYRDILDPWTGKFVPSASMTTMSSFTVKKKRPEKETEKKSTLATELHKIAKEEKNKLRYDDPKTWTPIMKNLYDKILAGCREEAKKGFFTYSNSFTESISRLKTREILALHDYLIHVDGFQGNYSHSREFNKEVINFTFTLKW